MIKRIITNLIDVTAKSLSTFTMGVIVPLFVCVIYSNTEGYLF